MRLSPASSLANAREKVNGGTGATCLAINGGFSKKSSGLAAALYLPGNASHLARGLSQWFLVSLCTGTGEKTDGDYKAGACRTFIGVPA